jgi:hypothetical protein
MTIEEAEVTLLKTINDVMNAPKKSLRQRLLNSLVR